MTGKNAAKTMPASKAATTAAPALHDDPKVREWLEKNPEGASLVEKSRADLANPYAPLPRKGWHVSLDAPAGLGEDAGGRTRHEELGGKEEPLPQLSRPDARNVPAGYGFDRGILFKTAPDPVFSTDPDVLTDEFNRQRNLLLRVSRNLGALAAQPTACGVPLLDLVTADALQELDKRLSSLWLRRSLLFVFQRAAEVRHEKRLREGTGAPKKPPTVAPNGFALLRAASGASYENGRAIFAGLRKVARREGEDLPNGLTAEILDAILPYLKLSAGGRSGGFTPETAVEMILGDPMALELWLKQRQRAKVTRRKRAKSRTK